MRASLVWGCLRLARLPSLPPPVVDPEAEARFTAVADELLTGEPVEIPEPRLDFLRWLAENRPVVFHGSPRDDLRELSTERQVSGPLAYMVMVDLAGVERAIALILDQGEGSEASPDVKHTHELAHYWWLHAGVQQAWRQLQGARVGVVRAPEQMRAPLLESVREPAGRVVHGPVGADQVDAKEPPALVHVAGHHEHAGIAGPPGVAKRRQFGMRGIVGGGRFLGRLHTALVRRHFQSNFRTTLEDRLRQPLDGVRSRPAEHHTRRGEARSRSRCHA